MLLVKPQRQVKSWPSCKCCVTGLTMANKGKTRSKQKTKTPPNNPTTQTATKTSGKEQDPKLPIPPKTQKKKDQPLADKSNIQNQQNQVAVHPEITEDGQQQIMQQTTETQQSETGGSSGNQNDCSPEHHQQGDRTALPEIPNSEQQNDQHNQRPYATIPELHPAGTHNHQQHQVPPQFHQVYQQNQQGGLVTIPSTIPGPVPPNEQYQYQQGVAQTQCTAVTEELQSHHYYHQQNQPGMTSIRPNISSSEYQNQQPSASTVNSHDYHHQNYQPAGFPIPPIHLMSGQYNQEHQFQQGRLQTPLVSNISNGHYLYHQNQKMGHPIPPGLVAYNQNNQQFQHHQLASNNVWETHHKLQPTINPVLFQHQQQPQPLISSSQYLQEQFSHNHAPSVSAYKQLPSQIQMLQQFPPGQFDYQSYNNKNQHIQKKNKYYKESRPYRSPYLPPSIEDCHKRILTLDRTVDILKNKIKTLESVIKNLSFKK